MLPPGRRPSLEEIADRLACADLLDAYVTAIDTRDWLLLGSLLAPDATLDYAGSGGPRGALDDVTAWLDAGLSPFSVTQHVLGNARVAIDGDEADARPYLINPMTLGDTSFLLAGRYAVRFRRTEDGWRIVELVQETTWAQGIDLAVVKGT